MMLFLPWCQKSRVLKNYDKTTQDLHAELTIGFSLFEERYISVIESERPSWISVRATDSAVFKSLVNSWKFFSRENSKSCHVEFTIDFEFLSPLHQHTASVFMQEIADTMLASFKTRANELYGKQKIKQ